MRKQDYLTQLIHSLNTNERRYFKLFNSPQKGAKKYELLFDELAKAEAYNAEALSKKLKVSKKQLSDDKTYLQQVLLKAMRNFHERDTYVTLFNQLADAHLLMQKQMLPLADEILEKTVQSAMRCSSYEVAYKALALQLITRSDPHRPGAGTGVVKQLRAAMEDCSNKIKLGMQFEMLKGEVSAIMDRKMLVSNPKDMEEVNRLMNNPLLLANYDAPAFSFLKHDILSCLSNLKQDFEACLQHHIFILHLVETWPEAIAIDGKGFFVTVNNLITNYISCYQLEPVEELTRKIKTRYYHRFIPNGKELDSLFDAFMFKNLAAAYGRAYTVNNIDPQRVKEFITQFGKEYKMVKQHIVGIPMISLLGAVSRCCFWIKDYEGAVHWTLEVMNNYSPDLQPDMQGAIKIWFAITHAEMNNYALLRSLLRNTESYLKKYDVADEADRITLRFLKKMNTLKPGAETQAAFRKLLDEYIALEQSNAPIVRAKLPGYKKWASEKLTA